MAQFDYFATRDDSVALLNDLLGRGDLRAYVHMGPIEGPVPPPPFSALTPGLEALMQRCYRVYLFGPFSTHPPLLRQQRAGVHAGKFFQEENGGGPLLTLSFGTVTTKGPPTFISGDLSTQPWYQLTPGHWEKPGPELKAAYQDLVKRMKKHLVRHQGLWIGPEALRLLQSGQVQLPAGAGRKPATSSSSSPPAAPLPRAAGPSR